MNGFIFYDGPSAIDSEPIVGIATLQSANEKTGPMIQTWIIRSDQHPLDALKTGDDASVCGECPLRGLLGKNRSCYVNLGQAPHAIYNAYLAGRYPIFDPKQHGKLLRDRTLRLGAYGDPTAIPLAAWQPLLKRTAGHTGYTHQWLTCRRAWSKYLMASVESLSMARAAQAKGWRTFRVRSSHMPLAANEIQCPASVEGGQTRNCDTCLACDGGDNRKRSVSIVGHGGVFVMRAIGQYIS